MDDNRSLSVDVQPSMVVNNLIWIKRGSVIASVDLHMPRIGFTFLRCIWGRKDGRDWVSPPQIKWIGDDGKPRYTDVIKMRRDTWDRFQLSAVDAIETYVAKIKEETG